MKVEIGQVTLLGIMIILIFAVVCRRLEMSTVMDWLTWLLEWEETILPLIETGYMPL